MPRPLKLAPLAAVLLFGLAAGEARAAFLATVTSSVTSQVGGYLYSYTVADLASSTANIGEFDMSLTLAPSVGIITPPGAPISQITMAAGFINTYTTGDPSISFLSTDPSTDITPGNSATFSFFSTYSPVTVADQVASFDGPGPILGTTIAPATVPEPSSLALSGLGALGSLGWLAARRRRAALA